MRPSISAKQPPTPHSGLFTLHHSSTVASWMAGRPARFTQKMVETACLTAGLTGSATLRHVPEQDVLKLKNRPARSISLHPSCTHNSANCLVLILTAENPRDHKVRALLTAEQDQLTKLATFIASQDSGTYILPAFQPTPFPNPVLKETVPCVSPAPTFDDVALALFLDEIRNAGGEITRRSLETIAQRLNSEAPLPLIDALIERNLILPFSGIYRILAPGAKLLHDHIDAPADDATKPDAAPSVSEFERLRQAILTAREEHARLKAAHDATAQQRTEITHKLTAAKEAEQSATLHLSTLRQRIEKLQADMSSAQTEHTAARLRLLDLEKEARALTDHSPALIQAERTLADAEAAYQKLIQI